MKAEIITYDTKKMTNSQRSIISKKLFGYKDKTKESKYVYNRTGLIEKISHLILTKKTFIVKSKDATEIKKAIKELGAKVKYWRIEITMEEMQKSYG